MNYMVMVILCDQFRALNEDFSNSCVGGGYRGQLSATDFEQYRRRHQALSRAVQLADRFLVQAEFISICLIGAAAAVVVVIIG